MAADKHKEHETKKAVDEQQPETNGAEEEAVKEPPFKEITPPMRKRLKRCFDHGLQLSHHKKPDYDYANTMFTECIQKDPRNWEYLDAFFDNLKRKYKDNKRGARFKSAGAARNSFKKAHQKKDWPEILRIGPEILAVNPWDVATLRAMAEACSVYAPEFNDVEQRYLKMALSANPKDVEVNRQAAKALTRMGFYDQAIACWRRVDEAKGSDQQAQSEIARLMVEKARSQVVIEDEDISEEEKKKRREARAKQRREAMKQAEDDAESARVAEKEAAQEKADIAKRREIELTPRQKLERAIHENPMDVDSYVALADLLAEQNRVREVQPLLNRAINACGDDVALQLQIIAFQLRDLRKKVSAAEAKAKKEKSKGAIKAARKLNDQLNQKELEMLEDRAERFPDSTGIKFELAMRNKRAGNYDEAIDQLAEALDDPERKALATLQLGECLQHRKLYQRALQTYQAAVDAAKTGKDVEHRKSAMYRAGMLAGGLKDYLTSQKYFQMLYDFDPDFKDVRTRLDKVNQVLQKR